MHVRVQLCAAKDGEVLWTDSLTAGVADIFKGQDEIVPVIAANAGRVILQKELERTRQLPLSNLESYTLYVSSISLLHRSSHRDFLRARELLDHLSQRHPNRPAPYAMAAKWHLMRILQGWSAEPAEDGRQALALAQRALRCDPENAFALATEGFVAAHFSNDLPLAGKRCADALELDPQEAQVWRMRAAIHTYQGEGEQAEVCAVRALSLTPLDPTRFIYELILGASKLACGRYDEALKWAEKSLRANVMHVPTHRLRVLALSLAGRDVEAREAALALLRISPHFSVDAFTRNYPGRDQAHADSYFRALRSAGLPA
jgi:tetratricopeptide (TPR) repeat protein